jgi:hypothetical protein
MTSKEIEEYKRKNAELESQIMALTVERDQAVAYAKHLFEYTVARCCPSVQEVAAKPPPKQATPNSNKHKAKKDKKHENKPEQPEKADTPATLVGKLSIQELKFATYKYWKDDYLPEEGLDDLDDLEDPDASPVDDHADSNKHKGKKPNGRKEYSAEGSRKGKKYHAKRGGKRGGSVAANR